MNNENLSVKFLLEEKKLFFKRECLEMLNTDVFFSKLQSTGFHLNENESDNSNIVFDIDENIEYKMAGEGIDKDSLYAELSNIVCSIVLDSFKCNDKVVEKKDNNEGSVIIMAIMAVMCIISFVELLTKTV